MMAYGFMAVNMHTAQITHQLGCTRITIHKYLDQGGFPRRESRATATPGRGA